MLPLLPAIVVTNLTSVALGPQCCPKYVPFTMHLIIPKLPYPILHMRKLRQERLAHLHSRLRRRGWGLNQAGRDSCPALESTGLGAGGLLTWGGPGCLPPFQSLQAPLLSWTGARQREASHLQSQCLNSGRSGWPPCWQPGNPDPSQRRLDQRGSCHTAPGSPTPASEMMQNEGPSSSGGPHPPRCAPTLKPSLGPLPPSPTFREWQGPSGTGGRAGVSLARGSPVVILNGSTLPSISVSARE